ncbi:MAG: cytochrome P450 [Pseudomonadota bacterium]
MPAAPAYEIDPTAFHADPYPDLARMRDAAPIAFVPQLGATLLTRHADISISEKNVAVFSSYQPSGLMTVLMGENMMRKDGQAHLSERKAIFPTVSPRTVADHWRRQFSQDAERILAEIAPLGAADLFRSYACRLSADALRAITGLTNMSWPEMDRVSQGMIDGVANYAGDPQVEARCRECTASIDRHIDAMLDDPPEKSLLDTQLRAGLPEAQLRANIKLAISGGQNEPRDAIAGTIWALLTHPEQLAEIKSGRAKWGQAFEEYARWISPIGMSPRRIAKPHRIDGVPFEPEGRAFLMFGSANRDPAIFEEPDRFTIGRDTRHSVAFGAGPHFCAGAWASRCLIAEIALPMLFERLEDLRLDGPVPFAGWAFRGPLALPCAWRV